MTEWSQKRSVMRRYDLTAQIYDMRYAEEQAAKIEVALENLGSLKLERQSLVLDDGCGTGLLFSYIADKAGMVVGLDISKKILDEAKRRSEKFDNVHLVLADSDYMPLKDSVFSHVFAITLIQNMPNPGKTLAEAKRVAGENAVMVVTGLKKKFPLNIFEGLLRKLNLNIIEIRDGDERIKCYVAICTKV
ncbi:MAG: methyltransferase domain-containing protein [Candidatus Bathyarchaeia archaeon]